MHHAQNINTNYPPQSLATLKTHISLVSVSDCHTTIISTTFIPDHVTDQHYVSEKLINVILVTAAKIYRYLLLLVGGSNKVSKTLVETVDQIISS